MRTAIPNFSPQIEPLLATLERAYTKADSRKKRAMTNVLLTSVGWGQAEITAFANCKNALLNRVRLSHRDHAKQLCFYVDASYTHWAGLTTQIPKEDRHKKNHLKRHEPLAFLSGRFTETQIRWSTLEKEAYSVMATLDRMHWLASSSKFELYTDHNNLIFIFNPRSYIPDLTIAAVRKVIRWAVTISGYSYECIHIAGADNIWADILTRWEHTATIRRLVTIQSCRPLQATTSSGRELTPSRHVNPLTLHLTHAS